MAKCTSFSLNNDDTLNPFFDFFEGTGKIEDLTPEELTLDADHMLVGHFYSLILRLDQRIKVLTGFEKDRPSYCDFVNTLYKLMNP
jgi:hypothetical protein